MADREFQPIHDRPSGARAFTHGRQVGYGDAAPSGRMRLDALAVWLQDAAYADIEDAGLHEQTMWVARRVRIRVRRFPRFGEHYNVTTFCSGIGRMWAERRTDIVRDGEGRPDVEAVAIWVHLDPERELPTPVSQAELDTYIVPAARKVTARLRHEAPPNGTTELSATPWTFRAVDLDIAAHVNNAAYWAPLEEELLAAGPEHEPTRIDVEAEYRTPARAGVKRLLSTGEWRWIVDGDESGTVHASLVVGDLTRR